MRKIFTLAAILFSAFSCASVLHVDETLDEIAWGTVDMIPENEKPVIAVYSFKVSSDDGSLGENLSNRMTTLLANAARYSDKELIIVSRQTFDEIFKEQNFRLSDLSDQTKQIEIGKFLGADLILTGDISEGNDDIYSINTQLIDIETGAILGGDSYEFWMDSP